MLYIFSILVCWVVFCRLIFYVDEDVVCGKSGMSKG